MTRRLSSRAPRRASPPLSPSSSGSLSPTEPEPEPEPAPDRNRSPRPNRARAGASARAGTEPAPEPEPTGARAGTRAGAGARARTGPGRNRSPSPCRNRSRSRPEPEPVPEPEPEPAPEPEPEPAPEPEPEPAPEPEPVPEPVPAADAGKPVASGSVSSYEHDLMSLGLGELPSDLFSVSPLANAREARAAVGPTAEPGVLDRDSESGSIGKPLPEEARASVDESMDLGVLLESLDRAHDEPALTVASPAPDEFGLDESAGPNLGVVGEAASARPREPSPSSPTRSRHSGRSASMEG